MRGSEDEYVTINESAGAQNLRTFCDKLNLERKDVSTNHRTVNLNLVSAINGQENLISWMKRKRGGLLFIKILHSNWCLNFMSLWVQWWVIFARKNQDAEATLKLDQLVGKKVFHFVLSLQRKFYTVASSPSAQLQSLWNILFIYMKVLLAQDQKPLVKIESFNFLFHQIFKWNHFSKEQFSSQWDHCCIN